jgi:hypothetical protein
LVSWQRADLGEGTEAASGGNGLGGDDETSENLDTTFCIAPSSPGAAGNCGVSFPPPADELLITEIAVGPDGAEFFEIHNPSAQAIELENVYITDGTYAPSSTYYYNIVDLDGGSAGGTIVSDFNVRFPARATIGAGEYITVSLNGSEAFETAYGVAPDYELQEDGPTSDGVPSMRAAYPGSITANPAFNPTGRGVDRLLLGRDFRPRHRY